MRRESRRIRLTVWRHGKCSKAVVPSVRQSVEQACVVILGQLARPNIMTSAWDPFVCQAPQARIPLLIASIASLERWINFLSFSNSVKTFSFRSRATRYNPRHQLRIEWEGITLYSMIGLATVMHAASDYPSSVRLVRIFFQISKSLCLCGLCTAL